MGVSINTTKSLGRSVGTRIIPPSTPASDPALILKYTTTTPSESIEIKGTGAGYNYDVDWGDSSSDSAVTTATKTHTYSAAGTYTVKITGAFPKPYFGAMASADRDKIVELSNWGDIQYLSLYQAFAYCSNMEYTATDAPDFSGATANTANMLRACFLNCSGITNALDLSSWTNLECVGNYGLYTFLQGCSNTSSVNLSGWNLPNANNSSNVLLNVGNALAVGTDINLDNMTWGINSTLTSFMQGTQIKTLTMQNWTLPASNNCSLYAMFYQADSGAAASIALDLSGWTNTNNISSLSNFMRASSTSTSPFISLNTTGWDTSGFTDLRYAFYNAAYLTEITGLGGWKGDSVNNLLQTWNNCYRLNFTNHNFDSTLWGAALTNLTGSMQNTFQGCGKNNLGAAPNLTNWYVNNITNFSATFYNAAFTINIDVSTWNFASAITLSQMMRNVGGTTTFTFNNITSSCTDFGSKFRDCDDTTSIIYSASCDLSGVTTYSHYAYSANNLATQTFDASVSFAAVTTFLNAWSTTSLNTASYDQILIRCEATNSNTLTMTAGSAKYSCATSAAATARAALIADHSWTINDGGCI